MVGDVDGKIVVGEGGNEGINEVGGVEGEVVGISVGGIGIVGWRVGDNDGKIDGVSLVNLVVGWMVGDDDGTVVGGSLTIIECA